MPNEMLDAALSYAAMGIPVFPLTPGTKAPLKGSHGLSDATTDEAQIREWWTDDPNRGIGARMGGGLFAVDVDLDSENGYDGYMTLREWESEHGELPETVTTITGRGGMHMIYRDRSDRPRAVKSFANGDHHIDVRGDGGFIVMPPSVHENGRRYEFENHPDDYELAEPDANVYALVDAMDPKRADPETTQERRQKTKLPKERVKAGQGRNNFLYEQGCSLRGSRDDADDDYIAVYLETLNQRYCDPPLPDHEVAKVVSSVCTKPIGPSEEARAAMEKPKEKRTNHVKVANELITRFSACFLDGAPAVFDGLQYRTGWDAVEQMILKVAPQSTDKARGEVMKYLRLTMPHEKASPPRYMGFANGVLDIETMELLAYSPAFRIPNVIPHDWNPDAASDVLDNTLRKIACGDPFIESNLCEFIGLCMYRSSKYAYAAVLLGRQGDTASNGKSTYIDLLRNVLGSDNYSALDLSELGQRFQQEHLAGMLANLGDDISSEFTRGSSLTVFKKAVAGTEITTDVKGRKGYKFKPYCTMVFSANKFPKLETADDGVMRRLFPIRFNAKFSPDDPDYDPDIGMKLATEECIEAAIVRGVAGLKRVIAQRQPTPNADSQDIARSIKVENSSILQWVEDREVTREDFTGDGISAGWTTSGAYEAYENWCHESGIRRPYAKPQFGVEICDYFKLRTRVTRRDGKGIRIYEEC